jgi:hypothetical protein
MGWVNSYAAAMAAECQRMHVFMSKGECAMGQMVVQGWLGCFSIKSVDKIGKNQSKTTYGMWQVNSIMAAISKGKTRVRIYWTCIG